MACRIISIIDSAALEHAWLGKDAQAGEREMLQQVLDSGLEVSKAAGQRLRAEEPEVWTLRPLDSICQNTSLRVMADGLHGLCKWSPEGCIVAENVVASPDFPYVAKLKYTCCIGDHVFTMLPATVTPDEIYEGLMAASNPWKFCVFFLRATPASISDVEFVGDNILVAAHWAFDGTSWIVARFDNQNVPE